MTNPAPRISFAEALRDRNLLGASFQDASWEPWHVLARVISGQELNANDMAIFRECTGRSVVPDKPRRLFLLVGRRGGKSRFLSALAVWTAALAADWRKHVAPGEAAVVVLMACDRRQARVLADYAHGLLKAPRLEKLVERATDDRIELANGAVLEICTNNFRSIRGRSAVAVIGDEACFWRADGESASSDAEVIAAATPSLMTAPGGGYLCLSSTTYRRRGYLHDQWKTHFGQDGSGDNLVWLAPSMRMNASLPAAEIELELQRDPIKNRAEYLSTWRDDLSGYVPADALDAATDTGVLQRPWSGNWADKYCAFVDGAAGAAEGNDSFCMSICRGGADGVVHVDRLLEFEPPFSPAAIVAELVLVLREYKLTTVTGDLHGWIVSEFRRHGITYLPAKPKTELYLSVLPMLLSGRLRLLDNAKLRRQFASLERSVGAGGKERIEEALRSGSHDDLCNVVSGAAVVMADMLAQQPDISAAGDLLGVHVQPRSYPGSDYQGQFEDSCYAAANGHHRRKPGTDRGLIW